MTVRTHHRATLGMAAAAAMFVLLCAQAPAAQTLSRLPASDYTVRAACPAPAPGHASCLALALLARTAQARAHTHPLGVARTQARRSASPAAEGDFGLRPQDLSAAYLLAPEEATSPKQTIALVDTYNDPNAEADLATYSEELGLPACTAASGCFRKVNEHGETGNLPFPATEASLAERQALCEGHTVGESRQKEDEREEACELVGEVEGWITEMSLDFETAHAVCPHCDIALVEAASSTFADLDTAEQAAAELGASEISNSWGGPECVEGDCVQESAAFNHPGVVITAAAGDDGYLNWLEEPRSRFADFPASSPRVVAVGGTRLDLGPGGERTGETVWNDGGKSAGHSDGHGADGGGCSARFDAQSWQLDVADWASVGCGERRAVADVAADADPYTGLAVYDSNPPCATSYEEETEGEDVELVAHWCTIGGTSLATPLIASVFALAGGAHGVSYPAQTLYTNAARSSGSLHDVSTGSNGECLSSFNPATTLPSCTSAQEAQASCSSQLICIAAAGYDGPTGLGTPNGLAAFQPPTGEEAAANPSGGGVPEAPSEPAHTPVLVAGGPAPAASTSLAPPTGAQVELSGLALTVRALIALDTSRPRILDVAFTFTSNLGAHVRVSLQKRVGSHRHRRWQPVVRSLTIAAVSGRNGHRLSGRGVLSPGSYRLALTPVHGLTRSIVFKIG
jgi:Subtilase family